MVKYAIGDLVGLQETFPRTPFPEHFLGKQFGFHVARMDDTHGYSVWTTVQGQALRQSPQSKFAGGVGAPIGTWRYRGEASNVNDAPALSSSSSNIIGILLHALHGFAGAQKGSSHIDLQGLLKILQRQFGDGPLRIDSRIVDENIDEWLLLKHGNHRGFVRNVAHGVVNTTSCGNTGFFWRMDSQAWRSFVSFCAAKTTEAPAWTKRWAMLFPIVPLPPVTRTRRPERLLVIIMKSSSKSNNYVCFQLRVTVFEIRAVTSNRPMPADGIFIACPCIQY